jgi:hypothetical protein
MSIVPNSIIVSTSVALAFSAAAEAQDNKVERIIVTGVSQSAVVMSPKNTLVDGPFGKDKNLSEIARSLTAISSDMLDKLAIDDLQDVLARQVYRPFVAS